MNIIHEVATLQQNFFFLFGILLLFGILGGNLAEKIKLPRITGYILAGMVLGPSMLGLVDKGFLYDLKYIKTLTLGFVGLNIGLELKRIKMKEYGSKIVFIAITQSLVTFIVVFITVYVIASNYKITYALVLASIATVTTPTPIVACIRSYKTSGSLTDLSCPIVAMDDIIGVIIFSLTLPISIYLAGHQGEIITLQTILIGPVFGILTSVIIGTGVGFFALATLKAYQNSDGVSIALIITITLLLCIGLSELIGTSDILIPIIIGVMISNGLESISLEKVKTSTDVIILPLLLIFFTISGADLNLGILLIIGPVGAAYIVFRVLGKLIGTSLSAKITKSSPNVVRYLGLTLIPQGGVALDMAIVAELRFMQIASESGNQDFQVLGTSIFTIIIGAVIIYKVFGEIIVKRAFKKSGEIHYISSKPHVV